jgi:sugar lactone lactonase YvrE
MHRQSYSASINREDVVPEWKGVQRFFERLGRSVSRSHAALDLEECDVRRIPHSASHHAECPRWDAVTRSVYWIDMPAGVLNRYTLATGRVQSWTFADELSALVVAPDGRALVAVRNELHWFNPESETHSRWREVPVLDTARSRFNDAALAPDGSVWIASMTLDGTSPIGRLLRVTDSSVETVAESLTIGNGPAFDPQRNVAYFADSPNQVVYRMRMSAPWTREEFLQFEAHEGFPDGMMVDESGSLWVAHYDGEMVSRWSPEGTRTGNIRLRGHCPTAVAQVPDADGQFCLAITTSTLGKTMKGGLLFVQLPGADKTRGTQHTTRD